MPTAVKATMVRICVCMCVCCAVLSQAMPCHVVLCCASTIILWRTMLYYNNPLMHSLTHAVRQSNAVLVWRTVLYYNNSLIHVSLTHSPITHPSVTSHSPFTHSPLTHLSLTSHSPLTHSHTHSPLTHSPFTQVLYAIRHTIEFGPNILLRSLTPHLLFGSGPISSEWTQPPETFGDEAAKDEARVK